MECRCDAVTELYGTEADDYAGGHLVPDETDTEAFAERYSCPDAGRQWVLDHPERARRPRPGAPANRPGNGR